MQLGKYLFIEKEDDVSVEEFLLAAERGGAMSYETEDRPIYHIVFCGDFPMRGREMTRQELQDELSRRSLDLEDCRGDEPPQ